MEIPDPTVADTRIFPSFDAYAAACERSQQNQLELSIRDNQIKWEEKQKQLEFVNRIKHGHIFGINRRCNCGLKQVDYHADANYRYRLDICPYLIAWLKEDVDAAHSALVRAYNLWNLQI